MTRFPTAGHLSSWARLAPGIRESAGKKKGKGPAGHGNTYLASMLGNAAASAGRTGIFLGISTGGSPGAAAPSAPSSF